MKAQEPARGILKDSDNEIYYVPCECGNDGHSHHISVDPDHHDITVTINTTSYTDAWSTPLVPNYSIESHWLSMLDHNIKYAINGFLRRCKLTWGIWKSGQIDYEASIIMNHQQAINYANTLITAIEKVKNYQKDNSQ